MKNKIKTMKIELVSGKVIYAYNDEKVKDIVENFFICIEEDTFKRFVIPITSISYIEDQNSVEEEFRDLMKSDLGE